VPIDTGEDALVQNPLYGPDELNEEVAQLVAVKFDVDEAVPEQVVVGKVWAAGTPLTHPVETEYDELVTQLPGR